MSAYDRLPDWYKRNLAAFAVNRQHAINKIQAHGAVHPQWHGCRHVPVEGCPQPETAWKLSA